MSIATDRRIFQFHTFCSISQITLANLGEISWKHVRKHLARYLEHGTEERHHRALIHGFNTYEKEINQ